MTTVEPSEPVPYNVTARPLVPAAPAKGSSRKLALLDFIERVGTVAILSGYAVYGALPHVSTQQDFKVAAIAGLGSAIKFVMLKLSAYQASQLTTP
jgi:hypothetical protein